MVEVIPAINDELFEEIRRKIKLVEPHAEGAGHSAEGPDNGGIKWAHIDVADGTFTPNAIWHNAPDLLLLETPLLIEVHLMIADMDTRFGDWLLPNVRRIIFHAEAAHDPQIVVEKIHEAGKEAGVAILPETEWETLLPFCGKADLVQTLAVPPGRAGQEFRPEILEKISSLRARHRNCIIEVDGGINLETGKKCVEAGANILVAANYIFNSSDIGKAIGDLKNASH